MRHAEHICRLKIQENRDECEHKSMNINERVSQKIEKKKLAVMIANDFLVKKFALNISARAKKNKCLPTIKISVPTPTR